jgi:Maleate cis-trans isomerase
MAEHNYHQVELAHDAYDNISVLKLGLLALSSDVNSEQDVSRMLPDDIHVFTTRLANSNPVTIENLSNMSNTIAASIDLMVPEMPLDCVMYACTSGTIAIGEDKLRQIIQAKRPNVMVTNPVSAMLAALKQLDVQDISVLNPYSLEVNHMLIDYFQAQGLRVQRNTYFNLDNDVEMTRVTPKAIYDQAIHSVDKDSKALFISCTALRSSYVIKDIEQAIGVPVITSNSAMVWHAIELAKNNMDNDGVDKVNAMLAQMNDYGRLFRQPS